MKIISEIPSGNYLIKVKKDELANILGFYSTYTNGFNDAIKGILKEEKDVDISDVYRKHRDINSIQKLGEYDKARKKLQNMLDALTPIEELLNKIPVITDLPQ